MSVVVPFRGGKTEADLMLESLARLDLRAEDEVIVADNTPEGVVAADAGELVRVVRAPAVASSYHARNEAAEQARNGWLLFLDADCRPPASLLDDYFAEPIGERCGIVAGEVVGAPEQTSLAARWARSRTMLRISYHLDLGPHPAGATANLLVRQATWENLGGFHEVRSGADLEFCWRAQEAGWEFAYRPGAGVEHLHPQQLGALLGKAVRYGPGQLWCNRRFHGSAPRPKLLRSLGRGVGGAAVWTLTGRFERGLFKLIDAAWTCAYAYGYLMGDNRAERERPGPALPADGEATGKRAVVMTDAFPWRSQTFVFNEMRALRELGWELRVESDIRPLLPERSILDEFPVSFLQDEPIPDKLRDLAWLASRHPWRCLRDLLERRRWASEQVWPLRALAGPARRLVAGGERHVHVHFAGAAALNALRISRIVGATYSVAAHAYEIFQKPRDLREKLERAAVAVADCDYTISYLRDHVTPNGRANIHRIVLGVDGERFRRTTPYPGSRSVVALGRYVEKKGFRYLVEAVARLADRGEAPQRTLIAGDGPLRDDLESRVERLGVADIVELPRAWGAGAVRDLLEGADVFVMPCVVAADGDRDSMPVVVKEALAMEVPVVGSDEVGLPEVVRPDWGLLVPPADPDALAAAIAELLALPPEKRAAMGAAGRAFVLEHCSLRREAEKLSALLVGSIRP